METVKKAYLTESCSDYVYRFANEKLTKSKRKKIHTAIAEILFLTTYVFSFNIPLLPSKKTTKQEKYLNGIRTHNHLIRKRTLNHLAKLAK